MEKGVALFVVLLTLIWNCYVVDGHLTYIAIRLPLKGNRSEQGSPWPQPVSMETNNTLLTLDVATFQFTSNLIDCDIIHEAVSRYTNIIKLEESFSMDLNLKKMKSLYIHVKDERCPGYPQLNMTESYTLKIDEESRLSAESVWGVLRGLETFSQLIHSNQENKLVIRKVTIVDKPRFPHRGIMLDTARHYLPVWILLKNMDAMTYNKMNVFHWHIVDDQSFPFQSKTFPDLSNKGAYSLKHVYTPEDVKKILDYGRLRGIRVIPEFDTPGHTQSWGKSVKDLLTPCYENGVKGVMKYNSHGAYEIVNPTLNSTYTFLQEFFSEVKDVFPDEFVHLGMDEAYHACWKTNPDIKQFMRENGIAKDDYAALEQYYIQKVLNIVKNLNKKYIMWQDPTDHGAKVQEDAIIEVWKGGDKEANNWREYMTNQTNDGHKVILSTCWYLNYISYGQDWRKYYECDPLNFTGTKDNFDRVLGGEACVWAEYIDKTNLLSRVWPRASAAAERLWSPNNVLLDTDSTAFRLDQHRCRMLKRGIPAEPILDGYCGDYDLDNPKDSMTDGKKPHCNSVSSGVRHSYIITLLYFCVFLWRYS